VSDPQQPAAGGQEAPAPQNVYEASRADKLQRIAALGLDPWGGRFDGHRPLAEVKGLPVDPNAPPQKVRVAGRIFRRRDKGKAHFIDLWDWSVRDLADDKAFLQVLISQKDVGPACWELAQLLDLGDFIGVDGTFGATRMGEPTVFAGENGLHFLGKSLQPHPDKWAGMQDTEFRLRHRYLDLIYQPETMRRSLARVRVMRQIRTFLEGRGYVEVETPTLHAIAGGAAARPFITHHNTLDIDLYLRIALELHLKRLLVGGIEKLFEIGRVFRNEGISPRHNPEFTMLELYQAYGSYETMMELTEAMVVACVDCLGKGRKLRHGERTLDFTPPWPRLSYAELFQGQVGVSMFDHPAVTEAARATGIEVKGKDPEVLVHHLFELRVEEHLKTVDRAVFVYDYPAGLCPLTKRKPGNAAVAERFELYVAGMELANAYTELNDPVTQEETFRRQLAGLPEEDSMAKMDEDFVRALRHGMPPAGGLGVGIDRLMMLLTDTTTIRDVILFPLLRPER
jgi:lysyl-tRNA synthetase, class II